MPRFFIELRKKWLLPILWNIKRKKIISKIEVRTGQEIYAKKKEIEDALIEAKRLRIDMDIDVHEARLRLFEWMTYGSSKDSA